jgi:uncharacterized protein (DUF302 family)
MDGRTWQGRAVAGALLIVANAAAFAADSPVNGPAAEAAPPAITTSTVRVLHRSLRFQADFPRFTQSLEKILGHFPPDVQQDIVERPKKAEERLKAAEGAQGLMIFLVLDHGATLNMVGARRNAKQYLIGNPLTAIQMTEHDIRAALYAPLRVLVYEQPKGRTVVEYDQPSSLFGQFGRQDVTSVALSLDAKLEKVLVQAAELSH